MARNCWSKKKPADCNVVTSSVAQTRDEEWDMETLLALNEEEEEEERDVEMSTSTNEEMWDSKAFTIVIEGAHKDERDVEASTVEEVYGEEVESKPSEKLQVELSEVEEKVQEELGNLRKPQEDKESNGEESFSREIQSSWKKIMRETTTPSELEEISESQEEFEESPNQQFRRTSRTRKSKLRYVDVGAIGEETFWDLFPEELSIARLRKLREQLNIRRRKSVLRGIIEHKSPPTYLDNSRTIEIKEEKAKLANLSRGIETLRWKT